MGGSENSGTPKSSIWIGFSIINHPFWGTPIFGNTHMTWNIEKTLHQSMSTNLLGESWQPKIWHLLEVVLGDDFPFQPLNIFMIQFMDPTVRGTILRTKLITQHCYIIFYLFFVGKKNYGPNLFVGGVYQAIENLQWFQTRIHELVKATPTSPTPMPLGHNFTLPRFPPPLWPNVECARSS